MIRASVVFRGRVQGVFFRANAKSKADELGVKGWVMNTLSGDVQAVFEGREEKVKALIEYCMSGQPYARVESADVEYHEYRGEFGEFEVKR